ncbi:O-antigen ligase family protein [Emticicia sp. 17c]|uniref:O-antigen ligase family protein n=1 Tax=Emticicia sp. 17c TaxID=3127704 RepID=UPI00301CE9F5
MDIWMWIYCFMIGYVVAYSKKENGLLLNNLLLLFALPMIGYSIYLYLSVNLLVANIKTADVALILLAIFPLTLRLKNEALKILAISFIGLIAMLSFKRTIILGVVMMASIYYYSILTKTKFLRWQKVVFSLLLIIGGIVLYRAFNFIEQESGGYILSRLSSIQEDRGSKRVDIYIELLQSFAASNIGEMLFGHGYLATAKYTELEILAHNDFLEIIFDFGLIALIAYVVFFFRLLGYTRKIYQYRNLVDTNLSVFIAGLVAFLFLGLLNCFITTPIYFSTVLLFFGLSIGDFEREKLKLKLKEQNQ